MTSPLITVVAAAVVEQGRLLVVSKQAAPGVFYLPGGKPEPGEDAQATLLRELDEALLWRFEVEAEDEAYRLGRAEAALRGLERRLVAG